MRIRAAWTVVPALLTFLPVACAPGAADADGLAGSGGEANDGTPDDGEEGLGGDAPGESPLYAVSTTLISEDTAVSYVGTLDSLDPGAQIDLERAAEFGGSARAYGPNERGVVYVTSSEQPTMTEVTFDDEGLPTPGRVVSFGGEGITGTTGGNVHLFLSPDKAYFVSQEIVSIVVWDPTEMAISDVIPLPTELVPEATGVVFYPRPLLVGDELVLVATPYDTADLPMGTLVIGVDTSSDSIAHSELDTRCHSFLQSAVDAEGTRYFGSSDYSAAEHFLNEEAAAPCMLRMLAGETAFDPTWRRTLDEELDTPLWTGVTQGPAGALYVQGTPSDTAAVAAAASAYEITISQSWDWYELADGDADPALVDVGLDFPPSFPPMPVDGRDYVTVFDDVDTTLVELTAAEGPTAGPIVPGFVFNVVRVR